MGRMTREFMRSFWPSACSQRDTILDASTLKLFRKKTGLWNISSHKHLKERGKCCPNPRKITFGSFSVNRATQYLSVNKWKKSFTWRKETLINAKSTRLHWKPLTASTKSATSVSWHTRITAL